MGGGKKSTPMSQPAKSRIMSAEAQKPGAGGQISSGSWGARAQSSADKNSNSSNK